MRLLRPLPFRRLIMLVSVAVGLLLAFGFAQTALAQTATNPLGPVPSANYFVTGDYVVGGVGLRGLGSTATNLATGTINIPDQTSVPSTGVPAGADIVAAFLYWQTVESTNKGAITGQHGFFNGYAITGTALGNPNAPTGWSSGGCSGSAQGSKTMVTYRADVRPFLPLDVNGSVQGNGSYQVKLADSGSNGGGVPLTLGATLVLVYRVESQLASLNSIVIYDGAFALSNAFPNVNQQAVGFYQSAASPVAKITHIVGNGQPGKSENVLLDNVNLPSLYPGLPPFPGVYNQNSINTQTGGGSWDNPTWSVNNIVKANDSLETASITTSPMSNACVSWSAFVFSTTVQNNDGDGLLDIWKSNQGYIDTQTGQWVSLPGTTLGQKDLFVEIDYVSNLDGSAGPYLHSHLPKRAALDMVADALKNQTPSVHVHLDLGPGIYQGDPYVISYPVSPPPSGVPTFPGAGGNAISEGLLVCKESPTLCEFPNQAAVGWKGGLLIVRNTEPNPTSTPPIPLLGNFQPGRTLSYHYVLFGHALGSARTYWTAAGEEPILAGSGIATLVSIKVSNNVGTVMLLTPPLLLKPGDVACSDICDRVTVGGALQTQNAALNGSYKFLSSPSTTFDGTMFKTTFNIQTAGVVDGTYDFFSEPQLGLAFAGPTSASGYSDVGGGDTAVTFGLWPADDPLNCQPDPSQPLTLQNPTYCVNQVGTTTGEAGTLLHELGHTLTLTHGGTFYPTPDSPNGTVVTSGLFTGQQANNPPFFAPVYGLNCNPAFLSSMNYLFQIRGFPDGGIGYSGQTLPSLSEAALNESNGIGFDLFFGAQAAHFTRWYAPPNALDIQLQNSTGKRFASLHCDGTPIGPNEPPAVRVDGNTFSTFIDWNNDLIVPDAVTWQDVNFNGSTSGAPDPAPPPAFNDMQGFSDWVNLDLRQIGARSSSFALSGGGGNLFPPGGGNLFPPGGGNLFPPGGGNVYPPGGGSLYGGDGGNLFPPGGGNLFPPGGGNLYPAGGGVEQDAEMACSTADPPTRLKAAPFPTNTHQVLLTWTAAGPCQVRRYDVWRATGSFPTLHSVLQNFQLFTDITPNGITGTPPVTTFTDIDVKNKTTYTYFVTDTSLVPNTTRQVTSGPSNPPATIFVVF